LEAIQGLLARAALFDMTDAIQLEEMLWEAAEFI
jgi:hypothetical protein